MKFFAKDALELNEILRENKYRKLKFGEDSFLIIAYCLHITLTGCLTFFNLQVFGETVTPELKVIAFIENRKTYFPSRQIW